MHNPTIKFLITVLKELTKYKLDLVGVQEVRWDRGGTEPYIFFYGKRNENHEFKHFFHEGIISAVKTVQFVSDWMSYITLRGRWCDVIIL
jgi:hypothetical protein